MSDIRLDFRPTLGDYAHHQLLDVINRTTVGDTLTITIEAADSDSPQADELLEILDDNGFDYQSKGGHFGDQYSIIARRKYH